jgi:hypothetical protein
MLLLSLIMLLLSLMLMLLLLLFEDDLLLDFDLDFDDDILLLLDMLLPILEDDIMDLELMDWSPLVPPVLSRPQTKGRRNSNCNTWTIFMVTALVAS